MKLPTFDAGKDLEPLIAAWQSSLQHFAVTMLFAKSRQSDAINLVLTKRTDHLRTHSGQIGMPGGRISAPDKTPQDTAFRETFEELGIPVSDLHFVGYLQDCQTLHGGRLIPCVARTDMPIEEFCPSPDEVASLVIAPWETYERAHSSEIKFNYFGNWRNSVTFLTDHHKIWGLTAGIIHRANLRKN